MAMAADYAYIVKAATTIKSILLNNNNVKIYLFNSDVPQEWFTNINKRIKLIGDQIVDMKINPLMLANEHSSYDRINNLTFARFLIPQLVPEDRVLYLDSDLIVDQNISELFTTFRFQEGALLAASKELARSAEAFNAGVLLMNNQALKTIPNLTEQLLKLGTDAHLVNGDQSVINEFFAGKIQRLSYTYNYLIGYEREAYRHHEADRIELLNSVAHPKIIHFVTDDKPWGITSSNRCQEQWWHYQGIDWSEICARWQLDQHVQPLPLATTNRQLFCLTADQELANIEDLIQALPNVMFNIGALTFMGFDLIKLLKYPNVQLFPNITHYNLNRLMKAANLYLDVSFGYKYQETIKDFCDSGKPALSFSNCTSSDLINNPNYTVFDQSDVNGMVAKIHEIIAK